MSSANGRLWVCNRVRTTSCGYVAIEAVIFAIAEQRRIVRGVSGTSEEPSRIHNYVWMAQHRVPSENLEGLTYVPISSAARKAETEQLHARCPRD